MSRLSNVLWMAVIVASAFLLYHVKYDVQALQAQIAETSRRLVEGREALNVAKAEWAYLNRPQRLKGLADKYLAASEITVGRVAEVEAIGLPGREEAYAGRGRAARAASLRVEEEER